MEFMKSSAWLVPLSAIILGLLTFRLTRWIDLQTGWSLFGFSTENARLLVGGIQSSAITFTVFIYSMLLLAVQVSSSQLSPRIVSRIFRYPALKASLGLFVFTFVYALSALARVEPPVPQLSVCAAAFFTILSIAAFLWLVENTAKFLRPSSIAAGVARQGMEVIKQTYPKAASAGTDEKIGRLTIDETPRRMEYTGKPGVLLAFDVHGLAASAERWNCFVRILPQIGDYVDAGDTLLEVYGGEKGMFDEAILGESVILGIERLVESDTLFSIRIIVDIAIKALSPAINDPTGSSLHR